MDTVDVKEEDIILQESAPEEASSNKEVTDKVSLKKIKNFLTGYSRSKEDTKYKVQSMIDSNMYDFSHPRRGIAVIINNNNFAGLRHQRVGSEVDIVKLTKMFTRYGFDIIIYQDLTRDDMVATLKMVASFPDHKKADCFACAICSHGDEDTTEDVVAGTDGRHVPTRVLVEIFTDDNCPGLKGKPRIVFIQACRGEALDDGQEIEVSRLNLIDGQSHVQGDRVATSHKDKTDSKVKAEEGGNSNRLCAAMYPHFLVMYAAPPGFGAWRGEDGSRFVKCLSDVFLIVSMEKTSLLGALTKVSRLMAQQFTNSKQQVPCLVSTLQKDVYFTPKR